MLTMRKFAVTLLVLLACLAAAYMLAVRTHGSITERGGRYVAHGKPLGAGYVHAGGEVRYVTRVGYYTGTSSPPGVRYDAMPVPDADPATFALLTRAKTENGEEVYYQWGKDARQVFYQGLPVEPLGTSSPIDPRTFSVIENAYYPFGKDATAVYEITASGGSGGWFSKPLPGLDPAGFAFVGDNCAKDGNSFYVIDYYGNVTATSAKPSPSVCLHPGPGI